MGLKRTLSEARPPSRAYLRAHYAEKAWKYHHEVDVSTASSATMEKQPSLDSSASVMMAPGSIKAARIRTNLAARAACLEDWERRLKEREKRLVDGEDALENLAMLYSQRSGVVLRALRLAWGREAASWYHHGAGFLLTILVLTAVLAIAVNWKTRSFQCSEWQGMASWGVMGYTVIAGLSYLARLWVEERAVGSKESGAYFFSCFMPFLHLATCLGAATWAVGISSICHAT